MPSFRLSTVGSRTFNVSAPRIWNALLKDVVAAPLLLIFGDNLKPSSFSNHILIMLSDCASGTIVVLNWSDFSYIGQCKNYQTELKCMFVCLSVSKKTQKVKVNFRDI